MSDWEAHTDSLAQMRAAMNYLGFSQGDGFRGDVRYTVNIYGQKFVPTGNMIPGPGGLPVTELAPLPGYYGILRWYSESPFPPPGINIPPGVTVIPLPADSPFVFA